MSSFFIRKYFFVVSMQGIAFQAIPFLIIGTLKTAPQAVGVRFRNTTKSKSYLEIMYNSVIYKKAKKKASISSP